MAMTKRAERGFEALRAELVAAMAQLDLAEASAQVDYPGNARQRLYGMAARLRAAGQRWTETDRALADAELDQRGVVIDLPPTRAA